MSILIQNLRFAVRQLFKNLSFTLTAVLSLAFGIGGIVAVFSLTDAILLRPLQFTNEARLVQVSESRPGFSVTVDPVAPGNYSDWKARNRVFTDMGAGAGTIFAITGNGRPEQVEGTQISASLLPILGVQPVVGRNFRPEDDQPGAHPVALISANLWQNRYGSDPRVTDKTIRLDGVSYSIAGVMPFGFTFHQSSQVWVPLALSAAQLRQRDMHYLLVYGLLRPHVTLDQARLDLLAISKQLQHEFPDNTGVISSLQPLREQLVGKVRPAILVLAVGVLTILLTTCANIAGLMIARSTTRERELSIKLALGASRLSLFSEQLSESVVLSIGGAAAGILLATILVPLLQTLVPLSLAAWAHPQIDTRALLFALVTCLLAATGFALASHRFLATHSVTVLRHGRSTVSADKRILRSALVGAQIALATVILIATGLLGETFWKLAGTDLGFNPEHVLTLRTELPVSKSTPYGSFEARNSFYKRVLESVAEMPGVVSAGYTTFLPLTNGGGSIGILPEGTPPPPPGQWYDASLRIVSPDYFRTIGMRLVSGRFLSPQDNTTGAPAAVITQTTARKYWPGQDPIGRRFRLDTSTTGPLITVVGVTADVRFVSVETVPTPAIFLSSLQDLSTPGFTRPRDLALRVSGDPSPYVAGVRHAIWSVDPEEPIANIATLSSIVDGRLAGYQLEAKLFGWFAIASLLLSSIGIYGLMSYDVAQRTREIGLRIALGAERKNVVGRFVGAALRLCLIGIFLGGLISFTLVGILKTLLYGVAGSDTLSRGAAALVVLLVALLAAYVPARRAARVDPMEALRAD